MSVTTKQKRKSEADRTERGGCRKSRSDDENKTYSKAELDKIIAQR